MAIGAIVVVAVVVEEEEEGAVDRNGNCTANGDGGPIAHSDCKDGDRSAAPRTRRTMMATTATATGGDRDHPMQGKSDHCNDNASDCN